MASLASTAVFPSCGAGARRGGRCVARASAVAAPAARTHYEALGVGAGASRGEIKAAYRRLAREVHPDAGGRGDEGFIRLHAAYATLADPDERARGRRPGPAEQGGAAQVGVPAPEVGDGPVLVVAPRYVSAPPARVPLLERRR